MAHTIRGLLIAGACALLAAGCASYPAGAPPIDEMDAIQAADDCVCLLAGEELCADGFEVNGGWSEYDRRYRYTYRLWLADDRDHHLDFEVQVSERGRVEVVTRNGRTAPCSLGGNPTRDEFAIRPRRALEIALDAGMGDDEHPIHVTLAWDVIKERALWWVGHRVPARPRPYEDVMVIDSQTGVVVDRYSEPIPEPTETRLEAAESGAPRVKAPENGLEVPRDAALSHLHAVAMVHTGLVEISFPKDPVTGAPAVSYRGNPDLNLSKSERAARVEPVIAKLKEIADADQSGSVSGEEAALIRRLYEFAPRLEEALASGASTIEAVAAACGRPADELLVTIAAYNRVVERADAAGLGGLAKITWDGRR